MPIIDTEPPAKGGHTHACQRQTDHYTRSVTREATVYGVNTTSSPSVSHCLSDLGADLFWEVHWDHSNLTTSVEAKFQIIVDDVDLK